ncbi:MAG TPA: type II toxin-antitoxin system RatA family toxin [Pseudomonadales bacterium]|nr:type II toxin-antitoxin system RatA family toxin [Pseudomonadales bacterium]
MPHISRSALVPYAAERMFDLVNDVERYPEFLPWCASAAVHDRQAGHLVAELHIARGGVRHRFTTRNALHPPGRMTLSLEEGPFDHFIGEWRFTPLGDDACKVELEMDFEYSGRIVRTALAPLFNRSADTMVDAFCARARDLFDDG